MEDDGKDVVIEFTPPQSSEADPPEVPVGKTETRKPQQKPEVSHPVSPDPDVKAPEPKPQEPSGPAPGSTNDKGQVYDAAFGWVTPSQTTTIPSDNDGVPNKMVSLTHQNLPLAMFLETSDLGFTAWGGSKTGKQSNGDIINFLGVGIVRFKELPPVNGEIDAPDVEYRVDTDVITAVTLTTNRDLTPDNPASVTFYIGGRSYRVNNIVIPGGDSQVVWVKWHAPSTPQLMNIQVSVSGAYTANTDFTAKIVVLDELIPPDPLATDTNPGYSIPPLPSNPQKTTANWGIWICYWVSVWVWCDHARGRWTLGG